jgi:phenylpyruvate tautomerase PptA (4-oxalocrotonate tautomerase family)
MPQVHIYVSEGVLDDAKKLRMIELVTDATIAAEGIGETARPFTTVNIHELPYGTVGFGGAVNTPELTEAYLAGKIGKR